MSQESGFLRYTAVTGDPNDFTRSHFKLRQSLNGRETELASQYLPLQSCRVKLRKRMIVFLTMYNEDEVLFTRTFTSIIKNIQYLQSRTKSKTWGPNAWKSELL